MSSAPCQQLWQLALSRHNKKLPSMVDQVAMFVERAHRAKSIDDLSVLFGKTLSNLGFDHWAYQLTPPAHEVDAKPRIISNYPKIWVERYIEQSYHKLDPVILDGAKRSLPFTWSDVAQGHDCAKVKQFFAEAAEQGLPDGFGLAMQGGNRAHAMVSASMSHPERDLRQALNGDGRNLHLISLVFHSVAKDLLAMERAETVPVTLTAREQECLIWAMKGKSGWDIATILNISESCVRFHLANIREKLDVTTIREAVVKAYMHGLIKP